MIERLVSNLFEFDIQTFALIERRFQREREAEKKTSVEVYFEMKISIVKNNNNCQKI